ncbi:MAG: hypothetical protein ACOCQB_02845 [Halanaerobiaceae bacterium]
METFDLMKMDPGEGMAEVFAGGENYSARVIKLEAGGKIPPCDMEAHLLFVVLEGEAEINAGEETAVMQEGMCLVSEPEIMSMSSEEGARLLGIQVEGED